ncbi:MAG: hypothetical protein N2490_06135 [Ignavibacteria bacterium]|nr:hypothetical protein [Ignavibacteria bacterium]
MKNKIILFKILTLLSFSVLIFSLVLTNKKSIATPYQLDTTKKIIKIEVEKIIDSIIGNFSFCKIDSLLKESLENLNFKDIDANVEYISDSLGTKQLKITVTGSSSDSTLKEIKKVEIKINDSKNFGDSIKIQGEMLEKNFIDSTRFYFKDMNDKEIKEYIKSHHKEKLSDEDIEITREGEKIIIKIKDDKIREK